MRTKFNKRNQAMTVSFDDRSFNKVENFKAEYLIDRSMALRIILHNITANQFQTMFNKEQKNEINRQMIKTKLNFAKKGKRKGRK